MASEIADATLGSTPPPAETSSTTSFGLVVSTALARFITPAPGPPDPHAAGDAAGPAVPPSCAASTPPAPGPASTHVEVGDAGSVFSGSFFAGGGAGSGAGSGFFATSG